MLVPWFESGLVTDTENQVNPGSGNPSVGLGREMVFLYGKSGIVLSQNTLVSRAGRAQGFSAYPDFQKLIFIITKKNSFILKLEFP